MSKAPPVPPAGQSRKGPSPSTDEKTGDLAPTQHHPEKRNVAEQGRQGNVRQNTRNQGYQQDR